jgi:hypothetical protein
VENIEKTIKCSENKFESTCHYIKAHRTIGTKPVLTQHKKWMKNQ